MNWTDRHWYALAVAVYGLATVYSTFLWRRGFRRHDWINYSLLGLGFLSHTWALLERGMSLQHCPIRNLYEASAFIGWSMLISYMLVGLWSRMRFLGVLVAPVQLALGVFALMPGLDTPSEPVVQTHRVMESVHAALALLAYGAFGLAAAGGGLFLMQVHDLKWRKLRAILSVLPPVQRLERVARHLAQVGWILLTLSLFLGSQLPPPPGTRLAGDPKVIWSAVLWVGYAVLLLWHWRGLSSRRFAWGLVGVFGFVLFTFWGTNLLSPLHHP
ncbi:MAG: cytochrome c biogenesis protein CcsA [Verrucomicrobiota bacterium]|nr:cytochrome c biogenesis protein [Limisphaera sp.]MDW8382917.1 cytochrome c biogenesis protein CcsA [Verrucomicrobiota bacterium]